MTQTLPLGVLSGDPFAQTEAPILNEEKKAPGIEPIALRIEEFVAPPVR